MSRLTGIALAAAVALPAAPSLAQDDAPAEDAAAAAAAAETRWKSRIDLGFTGSAGVSEDTSLRIAFTSAFKDETQKYTVDASYYVATAGGDRTTNKATTGVLANWPLGGSPWSLFAQGRLDFDEFNSWEFRLAGGGGVGYHFLDLNETDEAGNEVDVMDLHGRLGLGFRKEWHSMDEDIVPELIAGLDYSWIISERESFVFGTTIYPNLEEFEDYRIVTSTEWRYLMNDRGMTFTIGLGHEYQSQTDPGISRNDLQVYVSLGWEF